MSRRLGLLIPSFVVLVLLGFVPVLIVRHMAHPDRNGELEINSTKTLTLPQGRVDIFMEKDDENSSLNVPQLTVSVRAAQGGAAVPLTRDTMGQITSGGRRTIGDDNQKLFLPHKFARQYRIDVPSAGPYVVSVSSTTKRMFTLEGYHLTLGKSPPYTAGGVWLRWLILVLVLSAIAGVTQLRRRRP